MSIFKNIRSFEFDKNKKHIFGIKSAIIWGHSSRTNGIFPLLYLRKPKSISEEDYNELIEHIEISFKFKPNEEERDTS